jgi:hypothetical protein
VGNLGKCLLFYLKYPAEMERLYEAEKPNVKGLPNPDQILKKIKLVGDAASREAADLLSVQSGTSNACAGIWNRPGISLFGFCRGTLPRSDFMSA